MGVYKDMISYYTPLLGPLKSMAGQNTNKFLYGSILSAVSLEAGCIFRLDFLGVTVGMIVTVDFIIMDWWTEVLRHIPKQLLLETKGMDRTSCEQNAEQLKKITLPYLNLFLYTSGYLIT
jgi:hypothetical protein